MASFLNDTLSRKLIFFSGKGGVGKTSLVWATARLLQEKRRKCLVASWDPFGGTEATASQVEQVDTLALDALTCFREYALLTLKFEKLYDLVFDNHVLRAFVTTAPGVSDGVIAGKLWNLAAHGDYDHVLVDLPSTGHTVSFFKSPLGISQIFKRGFVHREATEILNFYQGPETRLDLITLPEELPLTECRQLKRDLSSALPLPFGFLHFNQLTPRFSLPSAPEISISLRATVEEYEARVAREEALVREGDELNLPVLRLNRLASDAPKEILEGLSRQLESA